MHKRHCSILQGPAHDIIATTYGINHDSVLNKLQYYHITTGLPPDIMHDILEGIAVIEIRCVLQVLIQDLGLFSLAMLNKRIQQFPYGTQDAANKPLSLPDVVT